MADCDLFIITDPSPIMPPSSHEYCDHVTMFVGPGDTSVVTCGYGGMASASGPL